jgi:hypothetical protein
MVLPAGEQEILRAGVPQSGIGHQPMHSSGTQQQSIPIELATAPRPVASAGARHRQDRSDGVEHPPSSQSGHLGH